MASSESADAAITRASGGPEETDDESDIETVCSHEAPDAAAIELLPDALLLAVLGFSKNPDRLALVLASKSVATRLKHARDAIVDGLHSTDLNAQLQATTKIRALLLSGAGQMHGFEHRPVRLVVDAGVVPRLIEFVEMMDEPKRQKEALWILTNITLGPQGVANVVVEAGAVPIFCKLVLSPDAVMCGQVTCALVQILGTSPTSRDLMLDHGAMEAVLQQLSKRVLDSCVVYGCVQLLSLLCKHKLDLQRLRPALAALAKFVRFPDDSVQLFACQGLAYVCIHEDVQLAQAIIDTGVCQRLIDLLGNAPLDVLSCALYTVGNICATEDDDQTRLMVDLSVLPRLCALLDHPEGDIRREAIWTIGNICAGPWEHVQAVFDVDGLVAMVITLLDAYDFRIRREAVTVLANIMEGGSPQQIASLVNMGCIPPLRWLLKVVEPRNYDRLAPANIRDLAPSDIQNLRDLKRLRDDGLLTDAEFKAKKALILGTDDQGNLRDQIQETTEVALICLARILLFAGPPHNPHDVLSLDYVQDLVSDDGGLERIDFLQAHNNHRIADLAEEVRSMLPLYPGAGDDR